MIIANVVLSTEPARLFLRTLSESHLYIPVMAILPESPDPEILNLTRRVADDFLFWPLRPDELKMRVGRILGDCETAHEKIRNKLVDEMALAQLVGQHPLFLHALEQAVLFGASDAPVLITGETGTGKELFAHAIHSLGDRRNKPFVPLDCGTLPDQLAENELFGHRRGAYTDAHADHHGLAGMAEGGTLFLDEIDALSSANQAKLLRFLQEGTYRSLGSDRIMRANVRVIAATNRPVEEAVRLRQFRSDLYFRLNVLRLQLPPVRERSSDVPLLARHFLEDECRNAGAEPKTFSASAMRKLESHLWPGNVRELFNTVRRAFVCTPGRQVLPEHIILEGECAAPVVPAALFSISFRDAKQRAIENFERTYVEELLQRNNGNVTRAAREVGKERRALGKLIKKYNVKSSQPDHEAPREIAK